MPIWWAAAAPGFVVALADPTRRSVTLQWASDQVRSRRDTPFVDAVSGLQRPKRGPPARTERSRAVAAVCRSSPPG